MQPKRMAALSVVALLMSTLPVVGANAQEKAGDYKTARQIVAERLSYDLTQSQISVFNLVAHASAAAVVCPQIDINIDAVTGALAAIINEHLPDIESQAEREAMRDRTLVGFGALVGLMISDAAPRATEFCKSAEAEMRDEGTRSFIRPHAETK